MTITSIHKLVYPLSMLLFSLFYLSHFVWTLIFWVYMPVHHLWNPQITWYLHLLSFYSLFLYFQQPLNMKIMIKNSHCYDEKMNHWVLVQVYYRTFPVPSTTKAMYSLPYLNMPDRTMPTPLWYKSILGLHIGFLALPFGGAKMR